MFGGALRVPFNLPEPDGCRIGSGIDCPIMPNNLYSYGISLPVLSFYPKLQVNVELALVDDSDAPNMTPGLMNNKNAGGLVCVVFPVQIV